MSEERKVVVVGGVTKIVDKVAGEPAKSSEKGEQPESVDINEEFLELEVKAVVKEARAERKARLARVLERGFINDRLSVDLPPNLHGEWVRDDPVEVARMEAMGFGIDTEHAIRRRLHSKGDSASYVGDVVFMTCSREDYEIMQEIRRERFEAVHSKKGSQKEERDFKEAVRSNTPELPVIEESRVHAARKDDISDALGLRK